jgi:hypothetical protein
MFIFQRFPFRFPAANNSTGWRRNLRPESLGETGFPFRISRALAMRQRLGVVHFGGSVLMRHKTPTKGETTTFQQLSIKSSHSS